MGCILRQKTLYFKQKIKILPSPEKPRRNAGVFICHNISLFLTFFPICLINQGKTQTGKRWLRGNNIASI